MIEWIDVNDSLPDSNKNLLVIYNNGTFIKLDYAKATMTKRGEFLDSYNNSLIYGVTHWSYFNEPISKSKKLNKIISEAQNDSIDEKINLKQALQDVCIRLNSAIHEANSVLHDINELLLID